MTAERRSPEVLQPGRDGTVSPIATVCSHAELCGGCSLLHLPYERQLSAKEASLRRLLGSITPLHDSTGSLFLPVDVSSEHGLPVHFRQKVAFVFAPGPSGRGLVMGHYQRGTQRVVPVIECAVHSRRGNRIAFALAERLASAGISAAGPSLSGILRHVIIRTTADDREAVAMLVVTRNDKALRKPVRALLDSPDRPDGFFININTDPGPFMVGDQTIAIDGSSHVKETIGGISYLIATTAFFQTNVAAASVLQDHVVRCVTNSKRVLDLYCGSGLFSLPLAASGAQVTGVEENRQAIADAVANAKLNRIPSGLATFRTARVEDVVRAVQRRSWDAVILDPPRAGCSDDVLEAVFQEMAPARAVYVSCNPEALAMELPGIVQCGYSVESLRAVDMFPHTEHVEVVVSLRRDRPQDTRRSGSGRL